jgi:hypothetical protein
MRVPFNHLSLEYRKEVYDSLEALSANDEKLYHSWFKIEKGKARENDRMRRNAERQKRQREKAEKIRERESETARASPITIE